MNFGVLTITIKGFDLAMYLSLTSLASCCWPGRKKSASSQEIVDMLKMSSTKVST